jgi:DNA-directed RNA polymerase I, II, and III subunit RPABC2
MSDEEDIDDVVESPVVSEDEIEEDDENELNSDDEIEEEEDEQDDLAPTKIEKPCEHYFEENFKKFTTNLDHDLISTLHPREKAINYDNVKTLCTIQRNKDGLISDPLHTTVPILTKFEYTRILGVRATQIENGAPLFISVDESIIDSYVIARMEVEAKKLPFIIRRPLPGGKMEYWRLHDLENLNV